MLGLKESCSVKYKCWLLLHAWSNTDFQVKSSVKVLKDQDPGKVEGLLNALRYVQFCHRKSGVLYSWAELAICDEKPYQWSFFSCCHSDIITFCIITTFVKLFWFTRSHYYENVKWEGGFFFVFFFWISTKFAWLYAYFVKCDIISSQSAGNNNCSNLQRCSEDQSEQG